MPFWDDIKQATQNVVNEIGKHGGLDGVIEDALGRPGIATIANTGDTAFHGAEAIRHSEWSMHYSRMEVQLHQDAMVEMDKVGSNLDNAWDSMVHGKGGSGFFDRLKNTGSSLGDAFGDAVGAGKTVFQARDYGRKAHEEADYAGQNADLAAGNVNLQGALQTVAANQAAPNLTSPQLMQQIAGMGVGDALKDALNTVNFDANRKASPVFGFH